MVWSARAVAFLLVSLGAGSAQAQAPSAVDAWPEGPTAGRVVTFAYTPPPGTAADPEVAVWLVPSPVPPAPFSTHLNDEPVRMAWSDGRWLHRATVGPDARYLRFEVRAASAADGLSGADADTLGGRVGGGEIIVHDASGTPVRGAYVDRARGRPFDAAPSDSARTVQRVADYRQELAFHPDHFDARVQLLELLAETPGEDREPLLAEMDSAVGALRSAMQGSEAFYGRAMAAYTRLGWQEEAESLRAEAVAAHPDGALAVAERFGAALQEPDPAHRRVMLEALVPLVRSGRSALGGSVWRALVPLYAAAGAEADALRAAEATVAQAGDQPASTRASVARVLATHGVGLEEALAYAQEALVHLEEEAYAFGRGGAVQAGGAAQQPELLAAQSMAIGPVEADRQRRLNALEGRLRGALGFVRLQRRELDAAERTLVVARRLAPASRPVALDLAALYERQGRTGEAYDLYRAQLLHAPSDTTARQGLMRSYKALRGTAAGFEQTLDVIAAQHGADLPEADAADSLGASTLSGLVGVDGEPVALGDSVRALVVGLWSADCGPLCEGSLRGLRAVRERFDSSGVAVLAVNPGWTDAFADAAQWAAEYGPAYAVPLAYDEGGWTNRQAIAHAPAVLVLDAAGTARFLNTHPDPADDLALQVAWLLEEAQANAP